MNRIQTQNIEVAKAFQDSNPQKRKTAAIQACKNAIKHTNIEDPIILAIWKDILEDKPVSKKNIYKLKKLEEAHDEKYLSIEETESRSEKSLKEFEKARAIAAINILAQTEPEFDEAIYEAINALQEKDMESAYNIVKQLLQ